MRKAEFAVGCRPIQHDMGDANAILLGERHQCIGIFAVHVEYHESRPSGVELIRLVEQ